MAEREVENIAAALARLAAHLEAAARAQNQLPPVTSKRSGAIARFELRLKRGLKRALRWLTWEQVNFNTAVGSALGELHAALTIYERERADRQIRASLETNAEAEAAQKLDALNERLEQLFEEQRVCFRQLAFEISETMVRDERRARTIEAGLDELRGRIEKLRVAQTELDELRRAGLLARASSR